MKTTLVLASGIAVGFGVAWGLLDFGIKTNKVDVRFYKTADQRAKWKAYETVVTKLLNDEYIGVSPEKMIEDFDFYYAAETSLI
jgi:hypothetical protein